MIGEERHYWEIKRRRRQDPPEPTYLRYKTLNGEFRFVAYWAPADATWKRSRPQSQEQLDAHAKAQAKFAGKKKKKKVTADATNMKS